MNYPNFQLTPGSISAALAVLAPTALAVFGKFQLLSPLVQATLLVVAGLVVAAYLVSRAIVAAAHKTATATLLGPPQAPVTPVVSDPNQPFKTPGEAPVEVISDATPENPDDPLNTDDGDVDKTGPLVPGQTQEPTAQ